MATFPESFGFRDVKGQTARMSLFCTDTTAALALTDMTNVYNLLAALTFAAVGPAKGAYTTSPTTNAYGTASEYQNIEEKAVFTFQTATGALHRYQLPCPKAAIFLADKETIDPANTDVAAFTAAVIANKVSSRDGSLITAFVGGVLARRKMQRRFNIYTKNPQLTTPGE